MTKHRKKKANVRQQEKVARAQHKNEFIRKMRKVLDAIGCNHVLALMPPKELELLYNMRCHTINITIAPGDTMPPGNLKWIKQMMSAMLKRYEVQLMPGGKPVDLDTYFTAGITVLWYANSLTFEEYPKAAQVKEALIPYYYEKDLKHQAYVHLRQFAETISLIMSDLTKCIFWATVNMKAMKADSQYAYHMEWHSTVPEKRMVPVGGENHTVYRLGIARYQTGPEWLQFKAGHNIPGADPDKEVKVYVQSHVMKRLYERIDCIPKESVFVEFLNSLREPVITYNTQTRKILIEYQLFNVKTGYLLATMAGNRLIIRTFLFITLTGSPEGERLHKNARIKKDDVTFLEIDRLSTFMTPEIQQNKHIKQFFVEAGMKSLFDLYDIIKDKDITITKHPNTTLLEDYLGIDLTKEFPDEGEENTDEWEAGYEEELDRGCEEPTDQAALTQPEVKPAAAPPAPKTLPWTKRAWMALITFGIRVIDLLGVNLTLLDKKLDDKSKNDDPKSFAFDKDSKFSSSKFNLAGKITAWILLLFGGIIYTLVTLPPFLIKLLIKGKKKTAQRIDYKQFLAGRRRKKKSRK